MNVTDRELFIVHGQYGAQEGWKGWWKAPGKH